MPPKKFFDHTGKPVVVEPLMLTGVTEWPFEKVEIKKLRGWPKFAEETAEVREKKLRETFSECAEKNLLPEFQAGIAANMPMDVLTEEEYTLLQTAVYSGASNVVKHLLEIGANPGHRSGVRSYDALCVAASAGQYQIAKEILGYANKDRSLTTAQTNSETSDLVKLSQSKIDPETTDMFGQSILQIAISSHRFDFAKQWIEEQQPDLDYVDNLGRNALATTLGIYLRKSFNTLETNPKNIEKLEEFCLYLLSKMNAFKKPDASHGLTPIQIVLHTHLALNAEIGKQKPKTAAAAKMVKRIYLNNFAVAKKLVEQAKENSGVEGAGKYTSLFDQFDIEHKEHQRYLREQARKNATK